jgi:hypothetical protein
LSSPSSPCGYATAVGGIAVAKCEPPSVDLLRSTQLPGRGGYSSEPTRLIMGNSALPTRGSPLTGQTYLPRNQHCFCFRFSLFTVQLYIPIQSTVLGFDDRQFNIQCRRSIIAQQSFGRQLTHTDGYASRPPIYIYREQRNICRRYCPCTPQKLSTMTS